MSTDTLATKSIDYFDFKSTDMESGKNLLTIIMETLGARLETPNWYKRFNDVWEFNQIIVGKVAIPVGISTGGVVSFEGDPFTKKDRELNITAKAVTQSISEQIAMRAFVHF